MNKLFEKIISRSVDAAKASLSTLVTDSAVILNYHRVNVPTSSANNLTVSTEFFREQMKVLREHFDPIALCTLRNKQKLIRNHLSKDKKKVVVTFDDGYADTLLNAYPILEEFDIPASVYITTGMIDKKSEFWWDELEELIVKILSDDGLHAVERIVQEEFGVSVSVGGGRENFYLQLTPLFKPMTEARIAEVLSKIRRVAGTEALARDPQRPMTMAELIELSKKPLIEIGAHTVHHESLGHLDYATQYSEMKNSKAFLEKNLEIKVRTIAYPFGSAGDFNEDTKMIAETLGLELGLTTVGGVTTPVTAPYEVPRMYVKNWNGKEFLQKLNKFFYTA